MTSNKDALKAQYSAIADAVRSKTGDTAQIKLQDMSQAIAGITTGTDVSLHFENISGASWVFTFSKPLKSSENIAFVVYIEDYEYSGGNSFQLRRLAIWFDDELKDYAYDGVYGRSFYFGNSNYLTCISSIEPTSTGARINFNRDFYTRNKYMYVVAFNYSKPYEGEIDAVAS